MAIESRCIFLTGAPRADELDWSEGSLLSAQTRPQSSPITQSSPLAALPKWRAIEVEPERHPAQPSSTGHSFQTDVDFIIPDLEQQDFLDHSFALLQDPTVSYTDMTESTFMTTASFASTMLSPSILAIDSFPAQNPQYAVDTIDLRALPTATQLARLHPQTPSFDLLCALISLPPARTVRLRRHPGKQTEVQDLLLGDETRAGFSVSCWLPLNGSQSTSNTDEDELRSSIAGLRTGDVVLLRNVALSVFRGRVYGQTLPRWRVGRQCTTIMRLVGEQHLSSTFAKKALRVREWVEAFVGRTNRPELRDVTEKHRGKALREEFPPDTQD